MVWHWGAAGGCLASISVVFVCRGLTRKPWIEGFDLDLAAGEIVALKAPSGSGKTLLLRALADLDPRDAGQLSLEGRAIDDYEPAAWRAAVLYLHQAPVPLPGDGAANVRAVSSLRGNEGKIDACEEILNTAAINSDTTAEDLSGGELQRLALYRGLALRPSILLLDEATSALDSELATRAEQAIKQFVGSGGAVLWVSHDQTLVTRVADRVVELPGSKR